jgi:hypothetical protein
MKGLIISLRCRVPRLSISELSPFWCSPVCDHILFNPFPNPVAKEERALGLSKRCSCHALCTPIRTSYTKPSEAHYASTTTQPAASVAPQPAEGSIYIRSRCITPQTHTIWPLIPREWDDDAFHAQRLPAKPQSIVAV